MSLEVKHEVKTEGEKKGFLDRLKWFVQDDGDADVTTKKGFMKEFILRIQKVDVTGLGSQLAFFFLLSLFPLLIFLITLLPYLNIPEYQILSIIQDYAPASVYQIIYETLSEVMTTHNGGLLSIGAIGTIWSASQGMNALTKALNRSYFSTESRPFYIVRGMSILFTLMLIGVVITMLVFPVFGEQIGKILFSNIGVEEGFVKVWNSIRWTITPVFILIIFTLIYWIVPNKKLHWKSAIPGAIFAALGWIITTFGFSFYVSNFANYSNTYGSIGGVIVLMMWLYFSSIILMVGGQVNAVWLERREAIAAEKNEERFELLNR